MVDPDILVILNPPTVNNGKIQPSVVFGTLSIVNNNRNNSTSNSNNSNRNNNSSNSSSSNGNDASAVHLFQND